MTGVATDVVACRECGCVNDEATTERDGLRGDIERLESELRTKRARISALLRDQTEAYETSPHRADALAVLEVWRELCAPDAVQLNGPRLGFTIKCLRDGYTREHLIDSVRGYAKRPFIVDPGKRSPIGQPSERRVEPDLIFRSPKYVEEGVRILADDEWEVPVQAFERLSWRRVQQANRRAIIVALEREFGAALPDDGWLLWPCPKCNNHPRTSLRIAPPGMSYIATCSQCGLTEELLLRAMR